ncbi:alpha/beta hydrolase [Halomarina litorea]|uniref:alpha/beta hydrolase n=1 Tax=Halomarina litorea TaxID=2961595 RepID=UPI0020C52E0B|nr:alpha/beta hydrolase [Halomarina sp. BCD28]
MREPLDPQVASVIDRIDRQGVPEWHAMGVECARRVEDEVFSGGAGPPVELVRNLSVPGPDGDIPIRVYRPEGDEPHPVLVYYHGGGWVLGTLDSVESVCRELADRTGCVVVSVDYRLAPEHPFPAAVDDAYAALEWTAANAPSLGGDPTRIGVAGTSAGGNLAAAMALRVRTVNGEASWTGCRREGSNRPTSTVDLAYQLLLYPITDHAFDRPSYEECEGHLLSSADMEWFWTQYLRSPVDGHNPFASPLRAPDLSGVAPATVVTAGYDPLRDEGRAYADRLAAADVPVDHEHYPSMCHGFLSLTDEVDVADRAMDTIADRVRSNL